MLRQSASPLLAHAPSVSLAVDVRWEFAGLAGLATLATNALPIAAATVVLDEPLPSGALGAIRVVAFVAVVLGAVLLARQPSPKGVGRAPLAERSP